MVSHRYHDPTVQVRRCPSCKSSGKGRSFPPVSASTPPILIRTVSGATGRQKRGGSGTSIFIVLLHFSLITSQILHKASSTPFRYWIV